MGLSSGRGAGAGTLWTWETHTRSGSEVSKLSSATWTRSRATWWHTVMKSLSTEKGRGEGKEKSRSQEKEKEDFQVQTGPSCQREGHSQSPSSKALTGWSQSTGPRACFSRPGLIRWLLPARLIIRHPAASVQGKIKSRIRLPVHRTKGNFKLMCNNAAIYNIQRLFIRAAKRLLCPQMKILSQERIPGLSWSRLGTRAD